MPRSRIRYRYITAYKKNPIQKNKINIPGGASGEAEGIPALSRGSKGEPRTSADEPPTIISLRSQIQTLRNCLFEALTPTHSPTPSSRHRPHPEAGPTEGHLPFHKSHKSDDRTTPSGPRSRPGRPDAPQRSHGQRRYTHHAAVGTASVAASQWAGVSERECHNWALSEASAPESRPEAVGVGAGSL
jgi:hypothetical protein